jgi:alpha 1,3-glucosidase
LEPAGVGLVKMETTLDRVPVYMRGGSIIPRKDRIRRSSNLTTKDPYTLIVALDNKVPFFNQKQAKGQLYIDQGSTFEYKKGQYIRTEFSFGKGSLVSKVVNKCACDFNTRIERIVVVGLDEEPNEITNGDEKMVFVTRKAGNKFKVTIKNPNMLIADSWKLSFK